MADDDTRNEREENEVDVDSFSGVGLETELQMESNISDKTKEMNYGKSLLSRSMEVTESGSIGDIPNCIPCEQSECVETTLNECGQNALLSEEPLRQDLAENVSTSALEILPEDPTNPVNAQSDILPEEEMADYEKEVNKPLNDSAKPLESSDLLQAETVVPMASVIDVKIDACVSSGSNDTEAGIVEMDDVEAQAESAMAVEDEGQIQVQPVFPKANSCEVDGNNYIETDYDFACVKEHSVNKDFVAGDGLDSEGRLLSENVPSDLKPSPKTSSLVVPEHSPDNSSTLVASLISSETEDLDTCVVHKKSLSISEIEKTVIVSQHNGFSQAADSFTVMDVVKVVDDVVPDDCSCESAVKETELTGDLDANVSACENALKESGTEYSEGGKEQTGVNLENSQDMSDLTDFVDHVEADTEGSDTGCDDKYVEDERTENEPFSKLDAEIVKASDASNDTIPVNDDALDNNIGSSNSLDAEISQKCDEMSKIDGPSDEKLNRPEMGLEDTTDSDDIKISKVKAGPTEKLLSTSPTNEIEVEAIAKEELDENSTTNDNLKTISGTLQTSDADNKAAKSHTGSSDNQTQQKSGKNAQLSKGKKLQECVVCRNMAKCKYNIVRNDDTKHLCDDKCFQLFRSQPTTYLQADSNSPGAPDTELCPQCQKPVPANTKGRHLFKTDKEMKKFCSSVCLNVFKKAMKLCANCGKDLQNDDNAIAAPIKGKGSKDFCCHACLVKYEHSKRQTTKTEEDDDDVEIVETTLAPKAKTASARQPTSGKAKCSICSRQAIVRQEVNFKGEAYKLCGDACLSTFRIMHRLSVSPCDDCNGMYSLDDAQVQSIQFEGSSKTFCSAQCLSNFKVTKQCIVQCAWCSTRKSNFDMVERLDADNRFQLFCSLNCLSMYRVNLQANSNQSVACDQCRKSAPALYHLTMSDASVRNFCGYNCVMAFQALFSQPSTTSGELPTPSDRVTANAANSQPAFSAVAPTQPARNSPYGTRNSSRAAKSTISPIPIAQMQSSTMPVISNIVSLAAGSSGSPASHSADNKNASGKLVAHIGVQTMASQEVIVQPSPPKQVKNKALLCKPFMQTKATSCRPHTVMKGCQTEEDFELRKMILPCPVPAVTPAPMMMYSNPVPYPVLLPVPIPIPVFIPTTKKSTAGIMRKIKELQERVPSDPFEAELLMMAEAVANANKASDSDSETEDEDADGAGVHVEKADNSASLPVQARGSNGEMAEDMLQMALRMAEMQSEQTLDLEDAVDATPIRAREPVAPVSMPVFDTIATDPDVLHTSHAMTTPRGRGRGKRRGGSRGGRGSSSSAKKPRVDEEPVELDPAPAIAPPAIAEPPADANYILKFTYGINAYKHWAIQKNAHLEQMAPPKPGMRQRLFKLDLLQCCTDELNYALCLFVKEVRKPNGEEYAPDSIYYLCLGIQEYLYENGRIDNLFTDFFYEKFTECLNEVLSHYEVRLNAQGMLVCRIEEEHLWEAKQLGAHSPHVLLNTLVYFNTKHFMLRSPEDHLGLSFSHIMKHWKKTSTSSGKPGRSVYLRYYAPSQFGADAAQKRKKEELPIFEQSENVDNPLRCPVKLYEFYLSKCPESIKNRSDVFYLVPERSCVPDSPVWYSAMSLGLEGMTRMLNRLRVVREIQESQLTSLTVPYYN